ncbi:MULTISPECIES: hypothetical protein [unclassified Roseitalea]|uniref:hypothetical protein n=1 Tax=unclassified Roseitalea TaxID=2639107 RepID=UPI00273DB24F|nr:MULTISPECIES: hypothetical protein [unclassified Roseitalea]
MTLKTLTTLTAACAAFALGTSIAQAGDVTRFGPNGGSATIHWSEQDGIVTRDVERIGPDGGTSSVTTQCGTGWRLCATSRSGTAATGESWSGQSATVNGPRAVRRYGTFTAPGGETYNRVRIRRK